MTAILCACGCGEEMQPLSQIMELLAEGASKAAVARQLNVSASYVKQLLKKPTKYRRGHLVRGTPYVVRTCIACGHEFGVRGDTNVCSSMSPGCASARKQRYDAQWAEHEAQSAVYFAWLDERREALEVRKFKARLAGEGTWRETIKHLRYLQAVEAGERTGMQVWYEAQALDAPVRDGSTRTLADYVVQSNPTDPEAWLENTTADRLLTLPREHPQRVLVDQLAHGALAPADLTAEQLEDLQAAYANAQNLILHGTRTGQRLEAVRAGGQGLDQKRRVRNGKRKHGNAHTKRGMARKASGPTPGGTTRNGHQLETERREARKLKASA